MFENFLSHQHVAFGPRGALDIDLGLEDRHHAFGQYLEPDLELLRYDRCDAGGIDRIDHRAFLGPEHAERLGLIEQCIEFGHRLHQLDAIGLVFQTLVDLDERHDTLFDQRSGHRLAIDSTVHRPFEQDRAEHFLAGEARRRNDPAAHVMDQREHFLLVGPGPLIDAIPLERLGGRSARLIERGDEALAAGNLLHHLWIEHRKLSCDGLGWKATCAFRAPMPVQGDSCNSGTNSRLSAARSNAAALAYRTRPLRSMM